MYKCEFWIEPYTQGECELIAEIDMPYLPKAGDEFDLCEMLQGIFRVTEVRKELWIYDRGIPSDTDFKVLVTGEI